MSETPHGTAGGYTNHRCRCDDCRRAWAEYMLTRRVSRSGEVPDHVHGTANGYEYYRCRCVPCIEAIRARKRDYYRRTESAEVRGSLRGKVCKWGHELTADNLYPRKDGKKACRECQRVRTRRYRAEKTQAQK